MKVVNKKIAFFFACLLIISSANATSNIESSKSKEAWYADLFQSTEITITQEQIDALKEMIASLKSILTSVESSRELQKSKSEKCFDKKQDALQLAKKDCDNYKSNRWVSKESATSFCKKNENAHLKVVDVCFNSIKVVKNDIEKLELVAQKSYEKVHSSGITPASLKAHLGAEMDSAKFISDNKALFSFLSNPSETNKIVGFIEQILGRKS